MDYSIQNIDIKDLEYGGNIRTRVSNQSLSDLSNISTKDMGDLGFQVSTLSVRISDFRGLMKKPRIKFATVKSKYSSVLRNINKVSQILDNHKQKLLADVDLLNKRLDENISLCKELDECINNGYQRLQIADDELAELYKIVTSKSTSGTLTDDEAMTFHDSNNERNRFEKRLEMLQGSKAVSRQHAQGLKLILKNNRDIIDKIDVAINLVIPSWGTIMGMVLANANAKSAVNSQRIFSEVANEILIQSANDIKQGIIDVATEAERSVIGVETLMQTNQSLIDTLNELSDIQDNGIKERKETRKKIETMDKELKVQLATKKGKSITANKSDNIKLKLNE